MDDGDQMLDAGANRLAQFEETGTLDMGKRDLLFRDAYPQHFVFGLKKFDVPNELVPTAAR